MGNFNKRDNYGSGRDHNSRRGDRPQMHQAICAECGNRCEVPFRPTNDKPIYCSACFEDRGGSNNRRDRGNRRDRRDRQQNYGGGEKKMFPAVCDKCQSECEVPFKPTSDKPIFCNDCFGKNDKGGRSANAVTLKHNHNQYEKQFEILNDKLDSILKLLSRESSVIEIVKEYEPKVEKPAKKEEKKATSKKATTKKKELVEKKEANKTAVKKKDAPKKTVKKAVKKAPAKKKK